MAWAAEHIVGVGKQFGADVPEEVKEEIICGLRANFEGECTEVGMYLAMSRVAHREGYPEIGLYWKRQPLRKPSTLQSLQSFWARLLPIPPRRIWR
jgi:hypothetical protein